MVAKTLDQSTFIHDVTYLGQSFEADIVMSGIFTIPDI